ncbi:MAG: sigma-70 family RNA polymerase sigma factor [Deltaproteobacteria bacterium]|nr:sigma-70 family RNA polymerase sigma factor [Deltaproteobacteria bacterium]
MEERAQTIEGLHRRYGGVIFDHCLRILRNAVEAEDAVQETFVSAFKALPSFRYGESHLPWLYRIATNACLKSIRARKRRDARLAAVPADDGGGFPDPIGLLHARRTLENLACEMDGRGMEILVAHCISQMDQGEIASHLGISRRAVVKRLAALRRRAAELFSGNEDG